MPARGVRVTPDKRNRLEETVFAYRLSKDGRVFISWRGKEVSTLKGRAAEKFLRKLAPSSFREAQPVIAKATDTFRHGGQALIHSTLAP